MRKIVWGIPILALTLTGCTTTPPTSGTSNPSPVALRCEEPDDQTMVMIYERMGYSPISLDPDLQVGPTWPTVTKFGDRWAIIHYGQGSSSLHDKMYLADMGSTDPLDWILIYEGGRYYWDALNLPSDLDQTKAAAQVSSKCLGA
jgi:hypothetical protein